jgi:hypothetical protein
MNNLKISVTFISKNNFIKMSHPLFESLQNSSSPQELISSIQEIIKQNDPALRVKEIIPIILGKKQLILYNNNKDQQQKIIKSVGALFQWLMPYTPGLPPEELKIEEEISMAAYEFCATPEVEAFVLEVMLPNAFEEDAIVAAARTVCSLVAFGNKRKLFTSLFTARQLLEMAVRAPTQLALEWLFGAMADMTYKAEDSFVQSYLTEKNVKLLLQAFQRADDGKCLEGAAQLLLDISCGTFNFSQILTPAFRSTVLEKLSITKSAQAIAVLYGYIGIVAATRGQCHRFFCTDEATKIRARALQLINDDDSADCFCSTIADLAWDTKVTEHNFATQELCSTIVKCFDFTTTDRSRKNCARAISNSTFKWKSFCPIFASIPNIVEKMQIAIKQMKNLNDSRILFSAIASICVDEECTRPFANLETLQLLLDSRKKVADKDILKSIDFAMNRIVLHFPEFLDFCAAQSDETNEHQQRLVKEVTTLEQLATFLENDSHDFFTRRGSLTVKRRSLLIICEKLDQFILSREENEKDEEEFQKILVQISTALCARANKPWEEILNHQFLDTVVFSLLQHGTGKTHFSAAILILHRIQRPNPPALSSSMLKVILEKMDEEDDKTCFTKYLNRECFFSVGIQLLRHAVSKDSRDLSKSFFIDNLNLIHRVFKKGYLLGDSVLRRYMDGTIDEIRNFDPQTKQALQIFIEKESGQRRDRDGNPSVME